MLSAYPNPFYDLINLSFAEPGIYQISIIDVTGREVHRQSVDATGNPVCTLSVAGLTPGLYYLTAGIPERKALKILKIRSYY